MKNNENKTERIILRLTPSEYKEFDKYRKKTGLTVSELSRILLLRHYDKIPNAENMATLHALKYELNQYGNNFNQIAKALNAILKSDKKFHFSTEQRRSIDAIQSMFVRWDSMLTKFYEVYSKTKK